MDMSEELDQTTAHAADTVIATGTMKGTTTGRQDDRQARRQGNELTEVRLLLEVILIDRPLSILLLLFLLKTPKVGLFVATAVATGSRRGSAHRVGLTPRQTTNRTLAAPVSIIVPIPVHVARKVPLGNIVIIIIMIIVRMIIVCTGGPVRGLV